MKPIFISASPSTRFKNLGIHAPPMEFFPFSTIRPGQDRMIDAVRISAEEGRVLLVHAPTGIGKTAASLAPYLEYAVKNDKVVVFLTPRHTQHRMVVETVRRICKKTGFGLKVIDIIGKKWLCKVESIEFLSSAEFNEYCRVMRKDEVCGFYNNTWKKAGGLSGKAESLIKKLRFQPLNAEEIKEACENLCPYEVVMQLAKEANVIVGDYFHLFNTGIRNAFLGRCNLKPSDVLLIVDEAHNLPGRIRGLMSHSISTHHLKRAEKEAESFGYGEIAEFFRHIRKRLKREIQERMKKKATPELFVNKKLLLGIMNTLGYDHESFLDELEEVADEVREERKRSYVGSFVTFLKAWVEEGKEFVRIAKVRTTRGGRKEYYLHRYCLDPSAGAKELFDEVHSSVLMSGTLLPLEMYRDLLGIDEKRAILLKLGSYFPTSNKLELVVHDVTTQYTKRDEINFTRISRHLITIINKAPPNVCVFFPSYELRDRILSMIEMSLEKEILIEKQGMSKTEKSSMLQAFLDAVNKRGACLLGVIGGSFDQGIDFPNNTVKCVVIVGLPLEKPDLLTEAMINYYEAKFRRGWDYAYIYPAVIKAQQAAGRAIRSEKDRAVIIYMDKRYLWANYRKCFPPETRLIPSKQPAHVLREFFA